MEQSPRYFTTAELAERWKLHENTVRQWIRDGRLQAIQLGRLFRVPAAEVERKEAEGLQISE